MTRYFFCVVTINKSLPNQSTYRHVFYFLLSHPHCVLHLKHLLLYSMCVCKWLPIFPFPWLKSALDKIYNKMRIFVAMHAVFLLNIILLSEWELPQQTYSKDWQTYLPIHKLQRQMDEEWNPPTTVAHIASWIEFIGNMETERTTVAPFVE